MDFKVNRRSPKPDEGPTQAFKRHLSSSRETPSRNGFHLSIEIRGMITTHGESGFFPDWMLSPGRFVAPSTRVWVRMHDGSRDAMLRTNSSSNIFNFIADHPKVKQKASAPPSRNSISKRRSRIGPG